MVSAWRQRISMASAAKIMASMKASAGVNGVICYMTIIVMAWRNAILIYLKAESGWRKRNEKLSYVAACAAESYLKIMKTES
jgi:hypothetical protein